MTKVLVADRKYDCTHMLGQFPTEADYDFLIEEDIDLTKLLTDTIG